MCGICRVGTSRVVNKRAFAVDAERRISAQRPSKLLGYLHFGKSKRLKGPSCIGSYGSSTQMNVLLEIGFPELEYRHVPV